MVYPLSTETHDGQVVHSCEQHTLYYRDGTSFTGVVHNYGEGWTIGPISGPRPFVEDMYYQRVNALRAYCKDLEKEIARKQGLLTLTRLEIDRASSNPGSNGRRL